MTRTVTIDLDDPDAAALDLLWQEIRRRHDVRQCDPELRAAITRQCALLAPDVAGPILDRLAEVHPAVVLAAHFAELVPDKVTIGWRRRHLVPQG